ncbi:unnamed protein product [Paramecium primaurelia]|uniref:Uncharacterized protein n=1 Tax=Paramecium primaurelia TaxID=5886 RepID=A0A8S1PPF3_PARPR|nr:unnamed protein product [Paramecium primaurelia]
MDLDVQEETIKLLYETIFEEICQFSIDQKEYAEWIDIKKPILLITKKLQNIPFDLERIQHLAQLEEEQKRAAEEVVLAEKYKREPKRKQRKMKLNQRLKDKQILKNKDKQRIKKIYGKMKFKLHRQYQKKHLSYVQLKIFGPRILLKCLLDQLQAKSTYMIDSQIPPSF